MIFNKNPTTTPSQQRMTISNAWMTHGSNQSKKELWRQKVQCLHEVRAVATTTGFKYYFDKQGGVYIWYKGKLRKQHPIKPKNPQTLKHNPNGGYLCLSSKSGPKFGKSNRGSMYLHRGVAFAFPEICGEPNLLRTQVDHRNNNMYDNRAKNLQWLSPSENCRKKSINQQSTIINQQSICFKSI